MYTPPHTVSHRLACILWLSVHGLGASYVPTLHGRYIAHHVSNTRMCCQSHCVGCWPGVQRRLWDSVANQSSSALGMILRAACREDPARPWDTFRLLVALARSIAPIWMRWFGMTRAPTDRRKGYERGRQKESWSGGLRVVCGCLLACCCCNRNSHERSDFFLPLSSFSSSISRCILVFVGRAYWVGTCGPVAL